MIALESLAVGDTVLLIVLETRPVCDLAQSALDLRAPTPHVNGAACAKQARLLRAFEFPENEASERSWPARDVVGPEAAAEPRLEAMLYGIGAVQPGHADQRQQTFVAAKRGDAFPLWKKLVRRQPVTK